MTRDKSILSPQGSSFVMRRRVTAAAGRKANSTFHPRVSMGVKSQHISCRIFGGQRVLCVCLGSILRAPEPYRTARAIYI